MTLGPVAVGLVEPAPEPVPEPESVNERIVPRLLKTVLFTSVPGYGMIHSCLFVSGWEEK